MFSASDSSSTGRPAIDLRLVSSIDLIPEDLESLLLELGEGDHRFIGTSFGRGEASLKTFLQECRDALDRGKIPPDRVPQTTFWLIDESYRAVGIVRVRHCLNAKLLQYGGHLGYYVRVSARGKGYGKIALRLGLEELRQLGVPRVLLTVHPENIPSRKVVQANGGVQEGQGKDPISGLIVDRFWIELLAS